MEEQIIYEMVDVIDYTEQLNNIIDLLTQLLEIKDFVVIGIYLFVLLVICYLVFKLFNMFF